MPCIHVENSAHCSSHEESAAMLITDPFSVLFVWMVSGLRRHRAEVLQASHNGPAHPAALSVSYHNRRPFGKTICNRANIGYHPRGSKRAEHRRKQPSQHRHDKQTNENFQSKRETAFVLLGCFRRSCVGSDVFQIFDGDFIALL